MTAAELLKHCKTFESENGVLVLLSVLETIFESQDQAGCIELLDEDDMDELDEAEITYFTMQ